MNFSIIIPSAKAQNLIPCVRAVMEHEPGLAPHRILVIDDGARDEAEDKLPEVTWIEGKKPFVYARNCNLGISETAGDVILLNDDALLETDRGFSMMATASDGWGVIGARTNSSGNPNQMVRRHDGLVHEEPTRCVPFICVYIPHATLERVGMLDESFTGYGFEDMDYCRRTRLAGMRVGIFDGCFVDHLSLKSTFRGDPHTPANLGPGRQIYERKWGVGAD